LKLPITDNQSRITALFRYTISMNYCPFCDREANLAALSIGGCGPCIREGNERALQWAQDTHVKVRREWGLPGEIPSTSGGITCTVCVNNCCLGEGEIGACGLRSNSDGQIVGVSEAAAKASWYHDPLPTNCVADWVCAGGTGAGYPSYANSPGPERGYRNLAVFFTACSFNCLYCQNWTYRYGIFDELYNNLQDVADAVDSRTSCICYFGGDPGPQAPYALKASAAAIERARDHILRICWETNGSVDPGYLDEMVEISLTTGGCVKFDLKAFNDNLHRALTGISNRRTLENFRRAAQRIRERPAPPLLVASTLMVPGYIDKEEVSVIASFIAGLDPEIPYSLLAFHPQFKMSDLPTTSRKQAEECREAAIEAGLEKVRIGNMHLLR
jgi:pyruvate formate lyase activating enzyme